MVPGRSLGRNLRARIVSRSRLSPSRNWSSWSNRGGWRTVQTGRIDAQIGRIDGRTVRTGETGGLVVPGRPLGRSLRARTVARSRPSPSRAPCFRLCDSISPALDSLSPTSTADCLITGPYLDSCLCGGHLRLYDAIAIAIVAVTCALLSALGSRVWGEG